MNTSTIKIIADCVKELIDLLQIKKQIKKRRTECRKRLYAKRRFAIKPGNDIPIYDDAFRRMPDDLFKSNFRVSKDIFLFLVERLGSCLTREVTRFKSPISVEQIILIGLKFKDLIPQQRRLICGEAIPYFLLGDSAFKLTSWMMKPFPTTSNADQVLFNRKHTLARRSIERTFGMVKSRFRRLLYCLHVRIDRVANVVDSAFTLHNICLAFSDSVPAESSSSSTSAIRSDSASSLASTPPSSMLTSSATSTNNVERLEAIAIRNALKEYFVQNSQRNQIVEDDDDEDEDVDE
ncbi:hypothetical protein BLOT_009944 [Blomia tropicalis]|nr:hypothetical protein BLOT_009944 [Blomia tropicalis]